MIDGGAKRDRFHQRSICPRAGASLHQRFEYDWRIDLLSPDLFLLTGKEHFVESFGRFFIEEGHTLKADPYRVKNWKSTNCIPPK